MTTTPLGDQALLAYFDDEPTAARCAAGVRITNPAWLVDVVLAYRSVALFFDPLRTRFHAVDSWLASQPMDGPAPPPGRSFVLPCCYELGPDLARVAGLTGLSPDAVIASHSGCEYSVFAVGFCPGFPYLGYLPDSLTGTPRLDAPRLRVDPGSVGVTGRQTGIYPLARPGGWNLIGRTPMELVDLADGYFALAPGDRVRFAPIGKSEFTRRLGERPAPNIGTPAGESATIVV